MENKTDKTQANHCNCSIINQSTNQNKNLLQTSYLYKVYISISRPPPFSLTIAGTEISAVDSTTNLGVISTSTAKTYLHCQQEANHAQCILSQLCPGFAVLKPEIFPPLDLTLVRPILKYGQQAHRRTYGETSTWRTACSARPLVWLHRLNTLFLERRRLYEDLIRP